MSADWIPNNSDDICEDKGESRSIADMVAQTASQFVSEQLLPGYVYYQEYGAYYNKESGYFYDPSSTLFFHPSTQCYYSYNEQTTQYEVYPTTGAVETAEETVNGNGDNNRSKWSRKNFKKRAEYLLGSQFVKTAVQEDVDVAELALELVDRCSFLAGDYCSKRTQKRGLVQEKHQQLDEDEPTMITSFTKQQPHNDGYICSSSDEGGDDEKARAEQQAWMDQEMDRRRAEEEISKNAPCIRLIERPANRLHIVTILGARIGFGPGVDIQMEDERNLGEECEEEPPLLLSIDYSAAQGEETKQRPVEEMGYRLEVVGRPAADGQQFPVELNGQEMEPNTKYSLRHEDLFRISNVEFAVHIHNGLNTCQGCEPGLFVSEPQNQPIKKKFSKHVERRRQMRALKAQYGLLGEDDDEKEDQQRGVELRQKYVDRARKRRMAVGSVGPVTAVQSVNAAGGIYRQCAAAPVAGCSADSVELKTAAAGKGNEFGGQKAIAESNKGFKLLQGMGWKSGQGLGKNSQGIQKPIETLVKNDRIGLGMESTSGRPKLVIQMSGGRQELLELTKRRYQQIESKAEQQEREEEKRKKK